MNRRFGSNLGIYAFGIGAIALGLIGLVWGDFAGGWQRVGPNVPARGILAYVAAICELGAGVALFWRRSTRAGAVLLTILYSVFTLLWIPKIAEDPRIYDSWGNFFEEFSLVVGGFVAFVSLEPRASVLARREGAINRIYGVSVISFGLVHVFAFSGLGSWIPKWIPPGRTFWAFATTVCFFLAAAAILSGILAPLAARLLTAMIAGFEIFVWAPRLFTAPHDHFSWAGNGISLAMAGAAWVVSDSISRCAKHEPSLRHFRSEAGVPA